MQQKVMTTLSVVSKKLKKDKSGFEKNHLSYLLLEIEFAENHYRPISIKNVAQRKLSVQYFGNVEVCSGYANGLF